MRTPGHRLSQYPFRLGRSHRQRGHASSEPLRETHRLFEGMKIVWVDDTLDPGSDQCMGLRMDTYLGCIRDLFQADDDVHTVTAPGKWGESDILVHPPVTL